MSRILDIQKKSNQYIASLEENVVRIIESHQKETLDINKKQLLGSLDANGGPLIHRLTGSEKLSRAYARRMGKTKPNLYVNGAFMDGMFLHMPSSKEYLINSDFYTSVFLQENYGKIMGIAPDNQPKAQEINDKLVVEDYLKKVFR
jgi:hypothetical protein